MAQFFQIHPDNPQPRLLRRAVDILREGGVIVYPTDSTYALGCLVGEKAPLERIRALRRLEDGHNFTLVCRDLSEIATYAKVGNAQYRLLKQLTPGPYTFIHLATKQVPRRLQHPKRKTIGIRVPAHRITQGLLETLGEPLMSSSLVLPGETLPMTDPVEIRERLDRLVDLVVDGGPGGLESTSMIDLTDEAPRVLRRAPGAAALLDQLE